LDAQASIKNYEITSADHWNVNINKNSILKFYLRTNTAANNVLINLNVVKR
jgi:hypothetical protein